jgi:RNA polymerase sigma-70 factor (ECF subfamily)
VDGTGTDLLARILAGDREAFGAFYDLHAPVLFGFCVRILKDARDAEDVLQETFVQAWRDARRFDPTRASERSWLFTIARSRALDRWRSRRSFEKRISAADTPELERAADAVDASSAADVKDFVARALAQLNENEQAVLRLAYFEGCTQEEIAERLNEPLGTVKSRTRSGLAKLRAIAAAAQKEAGRG